MRWVAGSDQEKYIHLSQKLPNSPIIQGLKRCFWHRKDQFEAVLILKRYSKDATVPPPWLEKGKLHTALLGEKWNAKIPVVFESFVYRIPANWTLSKLARNYDSICDFESILRSDIGHRFGRVSRAVDRMISRFVKVGAMVV